MDRYERITALHRLLKAARYPVNVKRLQEELGCSRATVYRDLAFLRDGLMAPIVGDGEAGFRYDTSEGDRFELPGLWLSSEELHSLLAALGLAALVAASPLLFQALRWIGVAYLAWLAFKLLRSALRPGALDLLGHIAHSQGMSAEAGDQDDRLRPHRRCHVERVQAAA